MDKNNLIEVLSILPEEIGKGTNMRVTLVDTPEETFFDFSRVFLNEINKNNLAGKQTVAILPVGPREPYTTISRLINIEKINCNNVVIFNMDEYCSEDGRELIPISSKLSFRRFMNENFYSKIDPKLNIKAENRIFPDPKNPEFIAQKIDELGGVDICPLSLGFSGHIAFNDPPEPGENISAEEFKNLTTRVLTINRETIIQGSLAIGGNTDIIPKKAITIGMKELLAVKKIYMYIMRDWQAAIVRKAIHGPITPKVPGSFLQEHQDITTVISRNAAIIPMPK